ncbi:unnamed protein product [Rangifer tarandus platyrhynchus]|uniref:Uncharacterized protein n=1 Tax=Rangifer tarandus platyrhynchus TaxID=3082113 RepID=A0AC59Z6D1_RANTA
MAQLLKDNQAPRRLPHHGSAFLEHSPPPKRFASSSTLQAAGGRERGGGARAFPEGNAWKLLTPFASVSTGHTDLPGDREMAALFWGPASRNAPLPCDLAPAICDQRGGRLQARRQQSPGLGVGGLGRRHAGVEHKLQRLGRESSPGQDHPDQSRLAADQERQRGVRPRPPTPRPGLCWRLACKRPPR